MKNMILLFDRVVSKILRIYRNYIFYAKTGSRASLVGNVTLITRNIKCGKNVTIYPDVMFFGDGRIEIGDNVDIGNGTIIYATKSGGGVTIDSNTAQCYIFDMDHGIEHGTLIRGSQTPFLPSGLEKMSGSLQGQKFSKEVNWIMGALLARSLL